MLEITVAVIAGFVSPQLKNPVALPFVRFLQKYITLEASEKRLVAFFGDAGRKGCRIMAGKWISF